jgi:hypothetical protein
LIPETTKPEIPMSIYLMQARFPLGKIYATPGALELNVDLSRYLRRHHCGDWGEELCAEDKQANEDAFHDGTRLLSCYRTPAGDRLYIITEHDRSVTTLLLPEEY